MDISKQTPGPRWNLRQVSELELATVVMLEPETMKVCKRILPS